MADQRPRARLKPIPIAKPSAAIALTPPPPSIRGSQGSAAGGCGVMTGRYGSWWRFDGCCQISRRTVRTHDMRAFFQVQPTTPATLPLIRRRAGASSSSAGALTWSIATERGALRRTLHAAVLRHHDEAEIFPIGSATGWARETAHTATVHANKGPRRSQSHSG